jgi:hypothetical protein
MAKRDMSQWVKERSLEKTRELLKGAIDIHVHAGPHLRSSPRSVDPVQAAIQARDAGMRAIVYMDVFEMTTGTAWIVSRVVPDFQVFGGIILNTVYGGMNPRAVKTAVFYGSGAKYVSFGAHSTVYQASKEGRVFEDGKFKALKDVYPKFVEEELSRCISIPLKGKLSAELTEILEWISANPQIYLNTGHVSPDEAFRLIDLAKDFGIKKVLVANSVVANMTIAEMKRAAGTGAYLERTLAAHTHTTSIPKTHYYVEPEYRALDEGLPGQMTGGVKMIADQVQEVGAEHFILGTDFGVYTLPPPVEGFREFIASMLDMELSEDDIRMMVNTNPANLLGLG